MEKDLYEILGVSKGASEDELKNAYKKLALKWHPDKFASKSKEEKANAEKKFKEINEAYQILSDPQKKQQYDMFGTVDGNGGGFSGGFDMDNDVFRSFFGDMDGFNPFGSSRANGRPRKAQDVRIRIGVSLTEIMNGGKKKVSYNVEGICPECHGEGGKGKHKCSQCNGTGMITKTSRTPFGYSQVSSPCPHCHGAGYTIAEKCHRCGGTGKVAETKTVEVTIRKWIRNGESQIFRGMGYQDISGNGYHGDLEVVFVYDFDTNKYAIDNSGNIFEMLDVDIYDCLLGADKKLKLPTGEEVSIKIPKCSHEGTNISVPKKGINGGNYIYYVKPKFPTKISSKEEEFLNKAKMSR